MFSLSDLYTANLSTPTKHYYTAKPVKTAWHSGSANQFHTEHDVRDQARPTDQQQHHQSLTIVRLFSKIVYTAIADRGLQIISSVQTSPTRPACCSSLLLLACPSPGWAEPSVSTRRHSSCCAIRPSIIITHPGPICLFLPLVFPGLPGDFLIPDPFCAQMRPGFPRQLEFQRVKSSALSVDKRV